MSENNPVDCARNEEEGRCIITESDIGSSLSEVLITRDTVEEDDEWNDDSPHQEVTFDLDSNHVKKTHQAEPNEEKEKEELDTETQKDHRAPDYYIPNP